MSRAYPTLLRLAELWTSAVAASAYAADTAVLLGPLVSGDPRDGVMIGYSGDPDGEFAMVTHSLTWASIGNKARDEEFDVHCCVLCMADIPDPQALTEEIGQLYGLWKVLADAVRADPSLGLGPGTTEGAPVFVAELRGFTTYLPPTGGEVPGVQPRIAFDVHVRTRV